MNPIGLIDLITFLTTLISLIILLVRGKNQFSKATMLSLLSVIFTILLYYLSNFLEWAEISDILVNIEDYIAILAPLLWFFFLYAFLQKSVEMELREKEKNIREAYKYTEFYKDLFTHDIRNILHSLLFANTLIEKSLHKYTDSHELQNIFNTIKENIVKGELLVSNVIKLSEVDKLPLPIKNVNLREVLQDTVNNVNSFYQHKNINIEIIADNQRYVVKANELLHNVFENILNNAINHNTNSTVEIQIKISRSEKRDLQFIRIEFLDNGIGIREERKKLIFQRMKQKSEFGMGLGLSLLKSIIKSYNGKIWVENRIEEDYSKGSNFILLIPAA